MKSAKIRADIFNEKHLSRKFFINKQYEKQVKDRIDSCEPMLFMPNFIQTVHDFKYDSKPYPTCYLLIGTTISGSKASVLLTDPPIYFDIFSSKLVLDEDIDYAGELDFGDKINIKNILNTDFLSFVAQVEKHCNSYSIKNKKYICKKIYNIGDTNYNKHVGIRVYFTKEKDMRDMLQKTYEVEEFFITSNYMSCQNSSFINNDKYTGSWMVITNYKYYKYKNQKSKTYTKAKHNFVCNFFEFVKPYDDERILYGLDFNKLDQFQGRNLELTWDIETKQVKNEDDNEDDPGGALNRNNKIFNICATVTDTSQPGKILLTIGLFRPKYRGYIRFDNDDFDIMCSTQKELLLTFASILEYLQPDIMTTYNGNGFDIPLYLLQCRIEDIFEEVHCKASISSLCRSDNMTKNKYGVRVNKDGYSHWKDVNTNCIVSGIIQTKGCKFKHREAKKFKLEKDVELPFHYWNIGVIHLDLFMIAKKKHPKSPFHNLSYILKINNINMSKMDLPYAEIWRRWELSESKESIYDQYTIDLLQEIDKYCKQDCVCTNTLRVKYMILEEKRAMCRYTHLPMEVVIYQADGVKVESGLGSLYSQDNFVYVSHRVQKHKYEGFPHLRHHIEPPKLYNKGAIVDIYTRGKVYMTTEIDEIKYDVPLPVAALDVASLYPNLMINYGLSLDAIKFIKPANGLKPQPGRLSGDYMEHYLPDLPKELDGLVQNKTIWIRKHHGDEKNFAIVPKFLWKLFNDRIQIKKQLAQVDNDREELIEKTKKQYPKSDFVPNNPSGLDSEYEKFYISKIKDELLAFGASWQTLNASQNTIKILMNTVYGVTKFSCNIFYCYFIAHIVTKTGRELITHVNSVINKYAHVDYNDTDSAYYHHDIKFYADIIKKYYVDRAITETKFRKKMVHRALKLNIPDIKGWYVNKLTKKGIEYDSDHPLAIEKRTKMTKYIGVSIQNIVNNALKEYTGYNYLKMVIEEILYTAQFLAKKKYFGYNHGLGFREEITEKGLLAKGISYVTRQTSTVQKNFNKDIMINIVSDLNVDCEQILDKAITKFYETRCDVKDYLMSFTYKPNTNNVKVIPFINRMKILADENPNLADLYHIPAPLEVIRYAIVKHNVTKTMRGTKKNTKKTDLAEYEQTIRHFGYEVDFDYYLMSLASTYAQFITYKQFDFLEPDMTVKRIKELIEKKHVIGKFRAIVSANPDNIKINTMNAKLAGLYKIGNKQFLGYVQSTYPTIYRILVNMYRSDKSTGYDYIISLAKEESTKPIQTKISPEFICQHMMPTSTELLSARINNYKIDIPSRVYFLNSEEIEHLRDDVLYSYKARICHIERKLEKAIFEYISTEPQNINYFDIGNILSEDDIEIVQQFEENIRKLIIYQQYYTMCIQSKIIM